MKLFQTDHHFASLWLHILNSFYVISFENFSHFPSIQWYLLVALICISWMTNSVEPFLMCLFAICVSSLVRCLFRSFSHLKYWTGLFILVFGFDNFLHIFWRRVLFWICDLQIFPSTLRFVAMFFPFKKITGSDLVARQHNLIKGNDSRLRNVVTGFFHQI